MIVESLRRGNLKCFFLSSLRRSHVQLPLSVYNGTKPSRRPAFRKLALLRLNAMRRFNSPNTERWEKREDRKKHLILEIERRAKLNLMRNDFELASKKCVKFFAPQIFRWNRKVRLCQWSAKIMHVRNIHQLCSCCDEGELSFCMWSSDENDNWDWFLKISWNFQLKHRKVIHNWKYINATLSKILKNHHWSVSHHDHHRRPLNSNSTCKTEKYTVNRNEINFYSKVAINSTKFQASSITIANSRRSSSNSPSNISFFHRIRHTDAPTMPSSSSVYLSIVDYCKILYERKTHKIT